MSGKTIRFEDLGGPVQDLLKRVKGVTDEDMQLFEFVSVKDMAKIYQEMGTDREATDIWDELKGALLARREKAEKKKRELERKEQDLDAEAVAEDQAAADEEAAAAAEAAARKKRKEERRKRRAEEAAAAEEQAALDAQEEEERLAQEEADRKAEEKARRRAAKKRAAEEERAALEEEREKESKKKSKNIKKDWDEYKAAHPLEFLNSTDQSIEQVNVKRDTKPPPAADKELMSRTYTPKCPHCQARFSKPPKEWDCPMCLRRYRNRIKCWQPDDEAPKCGCCSASVGRFSRHHCRNCGRVVCGKCSEHKALIPSIGFEDSPVKVCSQCLSALASVPAGSPTKEGGAESPKAEAESPK